MLKYFVLIVNHSLTYVVPACKTKGVGSRTIWWFLAGFFGSLFWLLYAIPAQHRDTVVLVVNCLGVGVQAAYVCIFLKYTVEQHFRYYSRIVMAAVAVFIAVLVLFVPLVIVTRKWSVKVIGIVAATFSTICFVGGLVDVVSTS